MILICASGVSSSVPLAPSWLLQEPSVFEPSCPTLAILFFLLVSCRKYRLWGLVFCPDLDRYVMFCFFWSGSFPADDGVM
jgi:hypothetical protein